MFFSCCKCDSECFFILFSKFWVWFGKLLIVNETQVNDIKVTFLMKICKLEINPWTISLTLFREKTAT